MSRIMIDPGVESALGGMRDERGKRGREGDDNRGGRGGWTSVGGPGGAIVRL